jgi:opacity protein-like surface antigen
MNKHVRAPLFAALLAVSAAPAMADDIIPYVEGFAGYGIGAMSKTGDIVSGSGFGGDFGNSGVYGGGIGLKMPIDNTGVSIRIDLTGSVLPNLGGSNHTGMLDDGSTVNAKVKLNTVTYLATVYADVDVGLPVVPYVGFGLGGAEKRIGTVVYSGPAGAFASVNGTNHTDLAWSGTVGATYAVIPHLELDLSYRYTYAGKAESGTNFTDLSNGVTQTLDSNISSHVQLHQFVAAIRYLF